MALTSLTGTASTGSPVNTKGAYVQLSASTPYASSRMYIILGSSGGSAQFLLMDIAIGAPGSEVVIVPNIPFRLNNDFLVAEVFTINVDIPAGSRLAARTQGTSTALSMTINVLLENRALGSLANPIAYGVNTGTSLGTQVDPGAVANTRGNYVTIAASTTARIDALLINCQSGGSGVSGFISWSLDIATGVAGSEVIVVPNLLYVANPAGTLAQPRPGLMVFPISIPSGTRLSARCQCNNATAGQRLVNVGLIGMQDVATVAGGVASSVAYLG